MKKITVLKKILLVVVVLISFQGFSQCPFPVVSVSQQPDCSINTGMITFASPLDDATSNFEYSINNGSTYQQNPVFTGVAPGSYSVKARNLTGSAPGCVTSAVTLTVNTVPGPINVSLGPPTLLCPTQTTPTSVNFDFSNNGQTSFTYSYSIDGGPPVTGTHFAPSNFTVPGVTQDQAVTFTLTWNGVCPSTTLTKTCYPKCVPPVLNITNPSAVCSPNAVNITLPAVTAGSTGGGTLSYWTNAAATIPLPSPTAVANSGTYYIKSTVGACSDIKPVVVTIITTPVLNITNPSAVCSPNTVNITLPAVTAGSTGGGTISYWTDAAATASLSSSTALTTSNTYYIKSTVGACFDIEPVVVTINPTPVLNITNPSAVCSPNTVDITLPAVTAGSTGGGTLSYWTNVIATSALANPAAAANSGTYYIKSALGACSVIKPVVVAIITTPVLNITNPSAVCSPNTVNIALPAVTAGSTGGGILSYWTDAAATTPVPSPTAVANNGTYYIKSTVGACFDIEAVMVTVDPSQVLTITNPGAACSPNTVNITLPAVTAGSTGGGMLSYWTNATATSALANPTAVATSGTYYIKSTLGACVDIKPVVVTAITTPVLNITNPSAVCLPNTINITLPAVTAGSTGGGTLSYWTDAAATTPVPSPTALTTSNTYYIKSTVGTCFDIEPVMVTINPAPVLTITNPGVDCSSNIVDITLSAVTAGSTGGGALSYWTNASATSALANPTTISNSGTYYIKSTLGVCTDIKPVVVTIYNPNLVITNPRIVCSPNTIDITSPPVSAGSTGGGTLSYWTDAAATTPLPNPNAISSSGIYYIKSAVGTCYDIESVIVTITVGPTPTPLSSPLTVCDGNQDGVTEIDLTTMERDILNGANYILSFYETISDAETANNAIDKTAYNTIYPLVQTLYVRAEDPVTVCYSVLSVEVNVNPSPVRPINLKALEVCDADNANQDGVTTVNLTIRESDVLALQPSASNYIVTYYNLESYAQTGTFPIIPNTTYIGSNGETIWVRVENPTTGCYNVGSFQLKINIPLALTTPTPLNICDDDAAPNDQYHIFDLTLKSNEITHGLSGYTVTYYPNISEAQSGTNVISNPTSYLNYIAVVQTLGVVVTSSAGCKSITTLDIRVLPIPVPITSGITLLGPKCDDNNPGDMKETFDLTENAANITGGDPALVLHYFFTEADAIAETNEIANPAAVLVGQNVWIRIENSGVDYQGNNCFVIIEQPLRVDPLPIIVQPLTVQNCDDDNDGFSIFDLTDADTTADLLGSSQLPADFTISYYHSPNGINPVVNASAYPNTANPEIIYITVTNNATGCVNYGQFTIVVNLKPTATAPSNFASCDYDGVNDGLYTIDLITSYIPGIIGGQTDVSTTFYDSQPDADSGTNPIADPANYPAYTHTLWIRVENDVTGCYELTSFDIVIEQLAEPIITSPNNAICVDYDTNVLLSGLTLDSGITDSNYIFEWRLNNVPIPGATGSTYDVTTVAPGNYSVVATNTSGLLCVSEPSDEFTVLQSGPPEFTIVSKGDAFSENQTIMVDAVGYGLYEYSLDDGPFQSSNVFENVTLGVHTVTVKDVKGIPSCGQQFIGDIKTIGYPHYFTPNGDGYHDTWNVVGLEDQPNAKIYIFDRYGKLLKQISSSGEGWNGTFTGETLPATDYWFTVEYTEQGGVTKEFKSHFSLMR